MNGLMQSSKPFEPRPISEDLGAEGVQNVSFRRPVKPLTTNAVAKKDDLVLAYRSSKLYSLPDSFSIYRIIGNDLLPRHKMGQSRNNLKFIIENEGDWDGCHKKWIVNRIINKDEEQKIIKILTDNNLPFIHIPFQTHVYKNIKREYDAFTSPRFFLDESIPSSSEYDLERREAELRLNRKKTLYVMNVNGARNVALNEGKRYAKWILPWDGNCFVPDEAWHQIVHAIQENAYCKYFYVPMARTQENASLLRSGKSPSATEEPQLIFRCDAAEEFDERFPYGQRSKLELLWRLGVPCGHWDSRVDFVWDLPRPKLSKEVGQVAPAGWVARLSSGQAAFEFETVSSARARSRARHAAIVATLKQIDTEAVVASLGSRRLRRLNENALTQLTADQELGSQADHLRKMIKQAADTALLRGPYSVTTKAGNPPSGDKHDYFHVAPYWWPDTQDYPSTSFVYKDGVRLPEAEINGPGSEKYDRSSVQLMFDDSISLALAWSIFSDRRFAKKGAELVRTWFLNPDTRMNPSLRFAQVRPDRASSEGSGSGLIEMRDLYYFLDAVRILEDSGSLTETEGYGLRSWFKDYFDWLQSSRQGAWARKAKNNHGTCFDLQSAAIAAYLGDAEKLVAIFQDSHQRLISQFDSVGRQRRELCRSRPLHYCAFNLQCWVNLAKLAEACGENLWQVSAPDGRGLRAGFEWLFSSLDYLLGEEGSASTFDIASLQPLSIAYEAAYGQPSVAGLEATTGRVPTNFDPSYGIMPFWNLG